MRAAWIVMNDMVTESVSFQTAMRMNERLFRQRTMTSTVSGNEMASPTIPTTRLKVRHPSRRYGHHGLRPAAKQRTVR